VTGKGSVFSLLEIEGYQLILKHRDNTYLIFDLFHIAAYLHHSRIQVDAKKRENSLKAKTTAKVKKE
jgi:hypothetical protein